MPRANTLRLRREFETRLDTREQKQERWRALTGDGAGNIEVPSKRNFIYIRRQGRSYVEECQNTRVPRRYNLPIIVGTDPNNPDILQVLEPDWGGMADPTNYPYVPYHHEAHEFENEDGGDDVTWIQKPQFVPLLVYPTDPESMQVNVYGGWYLWDASWHYFEADVSADLTGSIPGIAGMAVYVLISIDGATEALQYTTGATFPVLLPPADREDMIPAPPDGSVPLAAICLYNGITEITWEYIYDIRPMIGTVGPMGSGSAPRNARYVVMAANPILSDERVWTDGTDIYSEEDAGAGIVTIHRSCNAIVRMRRGGQHAEQYVPTQAGLIAALAACDAGDVVWLPPAEIYVNTVITIPNNVRIQGQCTPGEESAPIIHGDTTIAGGIVVNVSGTGASLVDIEIRQWHVGATPGVTSIAVDVTGVGAIMRRCRVWAYTGGVAGLASVATGVRVTGAGAFVEQIHVLAEGTPVDTCIGFDVQNGILSNCHATTTSHGGAATGYAYTATSGNLWNCYGDGETYGLRVTAGTVYTRFGFYSGITADLRIEAGATLEVYCVQYNITSVAGTLSYLPGDRVSPIGALHDLLSATHTDTIANPPLQGAMVIGNGTPDWVRLNAGGMRQFLEMDGAGNQPQWTSFDWDLAAAAVAADMVHDHSAAAEGGQLDWDAVWSDAVHTHESAAEGGEDIRPDSLAVNTTVPDQDGAIAQAEVAADPSSGGAGTARIYPKDDAGQSKYFFMDDAGSVYEIAGIVEDLTVTVGAAGDFLTIQAAIDWFKNWIIKGACVIQELDEAAYDEAVDFSGFIITPGATLTLQGDTRALAGITYIHGMIANPAAIANGGTFNAANTCTITVNAAGDQITIAGGTVAPDFDADLWVNGDKILVYGNDHVIYERVVSVALNNVITITVALPAAAFPGGGGALDDGSAMALMPNRSIERTVAGPCVTVNRVKGIVLDGWYLESSTGASCRGVSCIYGGDVTVANSLAQVEDEAFYSSAMYSTLVASTGAVSAWGAAYGLMANNVAWLYGLYAAVVACTSGFRSQIFSFVHAQSAMATHCTDAFIAQQHSLLYAAAATARRNTNGFVSESNSTLNAGGTMALSAGTNTTDYMPNPGGAGQYAESAANFGVLYKS